MVETASGAVAVCGCVGQAPCRKGRTESMCIEIGKMRKRGEFSNLPGGHVSAGGLEPWILQRRRDRTLETCPNVHAGADGMVFAPRFFPSRFLVSQTTGQSTPFLDEGTVQAVKIPSIRDPDDLHDPAVGATPAAGSPVASCSRRRVTFVSQQTDFRGDRR